MDEITDTTRRTRILSVSFIILVILGVAAYVLTARRAKEPALTALDTPSPVSSTVDPVVADSAVTVDSPDTNSVTNPTVAPTDDVVESISGENAKVETISRTPVVEGPTVTYKILYRAKSNQPQAEVVIKEQLKPGQEFIVGSTTPNVATYNSSKQIIQWRLKSVPVVYEGLLTYKVKNNAAQQEIMATQSAGTKTRATKSASPSSDIANRSEQGSASLADNDNPSDSIVASEPTPSASSASIVETSPSPEASPTNPPSVITARYGYVDVKRSGTNVKGDGVTDDTAALQALIDQATGSQTLYFPKGIYKISAPLRLPRTGNNSPYLGRQITLLGQNRDQAIIDATGLVGPMLTWSDGTSAARTSIKAMTLLNTTLKGTIINWEANNDGKRPLVLSIVNSDLKYLGNGHCDVATQDCMVPAVRLVGALQPYIFDVNIKGGSPVGGIGGPFAVAVFMKDSTGAYFKNLNFASGVAGRAVWIDGGSNHTIRNSRLDAGSRRNGASYYIRNTSNIHLAQVTGEGTDDNPFLKIENSKQVYVKNVGAAGNGRLARLSDLDDERKFPKPPLAWFTNLVSIEKSSGVTLEGGNIDDQARYLRWWKMKHPDFVLPERQGRSLLIDDQSKHIKINNVRIAAARDNQYDATTLVPSENVQIDSTDDIRVSLLDNNLNPLPAYNHPVKKQFWGGYDLPNGSGQQAWRFFDEAGDRRIGLAAAGYGEFINRLSQSVVLTLKGAANQNADALVFENNASQRIGGFGANGSVQIGQNGSAVTGQRRFVQPVDAPAVGSMAMVDVPVTLSGVQPGDQLIASPVTELVPGLIWSVFVESSNKAIIRLSNLTANQQDLPSGGWQFTVWKH